MRKRLLAVTLFLGILALVGTLALAVQDPVDPADMDVAKILGLNPELLAAIMGLFGLGIMGITQFLKGLATKYLKVDGWQPLARHALYNGIALACSAGVTYWVLTKAGIFNLWPNFALYGLWTVGVATGLWKSLKANRGG